MKESEKKNVCVYRTESLFCIPNLTQYFESTILQFKKLEKNKN